MSVVIAFVSGRECAGITRCAVPRRMRGRSAASRGTRIVAAYCRSLRFPTLRLPASATGGGRLRCHIPLDSHTPSEHRGGISEQVDLRRAVGARVRSSRSCAFALRLRGCMSKFLNQSIFVGAGLCSARKMGCFKPPRSEEGVWGQCPQAGFRAAALTLPPQRAYGGVERSDGADLTLAHEQLTPDLRRRAGKETARVGVGLQQRVEIGIEIHRSTSCIPILCMKTTAYA